MKVDCRTYSRVFEHGDGPAVLDDLTLKFWKNPYSVGDTHETAYRAGMMAVLDHIINNLNEAHNDGSDSPARDN